MFGNHLNGKKTATSKEQHGYSLLIYPKKPMHCPKDKPIAVTCSVGNRSSIASSILERTGFKNISNVLGGMTAWTNLGYPTKKET